MVPDTHDYRHESPQFQVQVLEQLVEVVPAVVTSPHPVVIRVVTPDYYDVRVVGNQVLSYSLALASHAYVSPHCHPQHLCLFVRGRLVTCFP